ncbi:hypothetical protein N8D56_04990 [Devosia sp. A8/3-2]|nr:hypothetical protein N8D56_04990 [Devosia sp. A8/3-2]
MATLKEQAEALGIEVNGRWSDETLQKKIDEAKAAKSFGGKGDHDKDGKVGGAAPSLSILPRLLPTTAPCLPPRTRPRPPRLA